MGSGAAAGVAISLAMKKSAGIVLPALHFLKTK